MSDGGCYALFVVVECWKALLDEEIGVMVRRKGFKTPVGACGGSCCQTITVSCGWLFSK